MKPFYIWYEAVPEVKYKTRSFKLQYKFYNLPYNRYLVETDPDVVTSLKIYG
jgi:hypothetical protein